MNKSSSRHFTIEKLSRISSRVAAERKVDFRPIYPADANIKHDQTFCSAIDITVDFIVRQTLYGMDEVVDGDCNLVKWYIDEIEDRCGLLFSFSRKVAFRTALANMLIKADDGFLEWFAQDFEGGCDSLMDLIIREGEKLMGDRHADELAELADRVNGAFRQEVIEVAKHTQYADGLIVPMIKITALQEIAGNKDWFKDIPEEITNYFWRKILKASTVESGIYLNERPILTLSSVADHIDGMLNEIVATAEGFDG